MNNTWACEEAKSLMGESLTGQAAEPIPAALLRHIAECPACRAEYVSLAQTATLLKTIPTENPKPAATLWESIEARLPTIPQEKSSPKYLRPEVTRQALIAQYTYLVVLGISLWCCLATGQPFFQQILQGYGFHSGNWLLDEYGLFIVFFSLGGFVSILSAPILIHMEVDESRGKSWLRRLSRFFGARLSLFAC